MWLYHPNPTLLVQVLRTGHLSAVRLVFPGTDLERGVTHLEYLQHLASARPRLDHSKRLLQDIQVIENSLIRKFYQLA